MRKANRGTLFSIAILTIVPACATMPHPRAADATGVFRDGSGAEHGTVAFRQHEDMLHATLAVTGLAPGMHGAHVHAAGQCEGPDFKSAGGHWNPDSKQHGHANPMGAHRGDLPQVSVAADGTGKAEFAVQGTLADMIDQDGASLVIHAAPDDDMTDPSGNSGARLLCAVVTPKAR